MRILWLKSDLLLPLDKGGRIRTWHLMRHLARRHEITYLAFTEPMVPPSDLAGMREVASSIVTIPRTDALKGTLRFYADAARHVVNPRPYAVAKYRSRAYTAAIHACLREKSFDVIVCDFLMPAVNLPRRLPCPAVLFTHNVESEIWRRHATTEERWVRRWLYNMQYRRMLRYERRALARFDGILAVSDEDRHTFARLYPGALHHAPHVVPTGVDTDYFAPSESAPAPRQIVFTGSMDWLPNEDAMLFFHREVLPLIRREEPEVGVTIVGRAPSAAIQALAADPSIRVTGRVDDVRPYMRDATVFVVPLRIGGGTRLKIFEAMAAGKAVVSTTVGAEGLPVVDGEHLVLADTTTALARAIVNLMRNDERRKRIEAAARALVVERYNWSVAARELETALFRFVAQASTSAAPALATKLETNTKGLLT